MQCGVLQLDPESCNLQDTPSGLWQVPHTANASELTEIEEQILMLQARKAALLHPVSTLRL